VKGNPKSLKESLIKDVNFVFDTPYLQENKIETYRVAIEKKIIV
jgi:hypothetical protein